MIKIGVVMLMICGVASGYNLALWRTEQGASGLATFISCATGVFATLFFLSPS